MKKIAILIMVLSLGSKTFGFLRDIALSYFYGASSISDVFLISQLIPMSILEFVGLGLLTGYIPLHDEIEKKHGKDRSQKFTNDIICIIIAISTVLVFFGFIFTKQLVYVFASGFEGETLKMAVLFTRITLFSIYFVTMGYLFKGYLQIKEKYLVSVITGFPLNLIIIIGIVISTMTHPVVLAIGSLIAIIVQFLILIRSSYKQGYRFKWSLDFFNEHIRDLLKLAIPMVAGISVNQINVIVDRTLASRISEGGISALNYANRLNFFVQGMFVVSLTTVMYPIISKLASNKDLYGLKLKIKEAINIMNILLLPVSMGALIFSTPIIKLLFGRGAFTLEAISITASALLFYSIGMVAFGLREVLSRTFYSLKDTKTPMINASIGLTVNVVLNILLSRYLGIGGLALATSISAIFTTFLLFISLHKKIGPFGMKQISISFLKILFASLVMGGLAKLSFNYLTASLSQNISLLIAIGVGAVSYFVIIYFMKIEDVDVIVGAIKKKLGRGAV